jgi:hypothetical protein
LRNPESFMSKEQFNVDKWITNYILFFNSFKRKTKFNQITAERYRLYKIPPNQQSNIDLSLNELELLKKTDEDMEVSIRPIEIPIFDEDLKNHYPTFIIGGTIKGNKHQIKEFSFSVCLVFITDKVSYEKRRETVSEGAKCEDSCCLPAYCDAKRIVRRFHFDYQPQHGPDLKFHMQIGGEFSSAYNPHPFHYCSEHFLEKPRIPCEPWDFLFLFDCMIKQFDTPLSYINKGETFWDARVKNGRDLIRALN